MSSNIPEKIQLKDFTTLKAYQKGLDLTDKIYDIAITLPALEKYACAQQMIRVVTSITGNVSEGQSCVYNKKELNFICQALGSCGELRHWLLHCLRRQYISREKFDELDLATVEIIKMLVVYAKRIKEQINLKKN